MSNSLVCPSPTCGHKDSHANFCEMTDQETIETINGLEYTLSVPVKYADTTRQLSQNLVLWHTEEELAFRGLYVFHSTDCGQKSNLEKLLKDHKIPFDRIISKIDNADFGYLRVYRILNNKEGEELDAEVLNINGQYHQPSST